MRSQITFTVIGRSPKEIRRKADEHVLAFVGKEHRHDWTINSWSAEPYITNAEGHIASWSARVVAEVRSWAVKT